MFLRFANFYCQFIQGFSKIARLLISLLKIVYLVQNLIILIDIAEKYEVVDNDRFGKINKFLFKSQKSKFLTKLKNPIICLI